MSLVGRSAGSCFPPWKKINCFRNSWMSIDFVIPLSLLTGTSPPPDGGLKISAMREKSMRASSLSYHLSLSLST